MTRYRNPILPGFYPDPSIVRVGDDYYLANSTFQWFPGIKLSRSRDLVHWQTVGYALDRLEQLNLRSTDDSMGLWAPTLRFFDGSFYLVVTLVQQFRAGEATRMSQQNLLFTAADINGPWSDPVYLHDLGIDPDIFRDTDGRLYIVSQDTKTGGGPRPERISIHEYDPVGKGLVGQPVPIWDGTELGITEGPHLYHRHGWYYLITAEGGTGYGHAVSLCRSRNLAGPYELAPGNPILTMSGCDGETAKSGHADLVETQNGEWWMVCLGSRPDGRKRCVLGRETFLLPVRWTDDGWLCVNEGRGLEMELPVPDLPECVLPEAETGNFAGPDWQVVRAWSPEHVRVSKDRLLLRARPEPLEDIGAANVVGTRIRHKRFSASVTVSFQPEIESESAGLVCYYDRLHHIGLFLTGTEGLSLEVRVADGAPAKTVARILWTDERDVELRVQFDEESRLQFSARPAGDGEFAEVGACQDGSILSDECAGVVFTWASFTGAFMCLHASGNGSRSDRWAEFSAFVYRSE